MAGADKKNARKFPGIINRTHGSDQTPQLKPDEPQEAAPAPKPLLPPDEALKADINLSALFAPHSGQTILAKSVFEEKTNSSNTWLQLLHLNSNIGIAHKLLMIFICYQLLFSIFH